MRQVNEQRLCGLYFLKPGFCSFRTPRWGNYKSLFIKCTIFYDTIVTAKLISKNDAGIFEMGERVTAERWRYDYENDDEVNYDCDD